MTYINRIDGTSDRIPRGAIEIERTKLREASLFATIDFTETTNGLATLADDESATTQLLLFSGGQNERAKVDN